MWPTPSGSTTPQSHQNLPSSGPFFFCHKYKDPPKGRRQRLSACYKIQMTHFQLLCLGRVAFKRHHHRLDHTLKNPVLNFALDTLKYIYIFLNHIYFQLKQASMLLTMDTVFFSSKEFIERCSAQSCLWRLMLCDTHTRRLSSHFPKVKGLTR